MQLEIESNQFTVRKFRTTIRVNKPPYKASNSCQADINCKKQNDKLVKEIILLMDRCLKAVTFHYLAKKISSS